MLLVCDAILQLLSQTDSVKLAQLKNTSSVVDEAV